MSLAITLALILGTSSPALASTAFGSAAQGDQAILQEANVYYVSTTGRDSNPGTSAKPFKTFEKAVSVLGPGDTLQVTPGTYYEPLIFTKSGTAAAPIDVAGNGAILNMKRVERVGINIKGSYVNVSNFEVTGAEDAGMEHGQLASVSGRRRTWVGARNCTILLLQAIESGTVAKESACSPVM